MKPETLTRIRPGNTVILMIHGILGTPHHFDALWDCVPQEWSIVSLTLEGHGGSTADFAHSSGEKWICQVEETVRTLSNRYEHIILMGHSMGCLLSIRASLSCGEKLRGMIFLALPLSFFMKPVMTIRSLRVLFDRVPQGDPWCCASRDTYGVERDVHLWRYLPWIPRFLDLFRMIRDSHDLLGQITVPCYAFHSRKDELVSARSLLYIRGVPDLELHILEESGHYYYPPGDLEMLQHALCKILHSIDSTKGDSDDTDPEP